MVERAASLFGDRPARQANSYPELPGALERSLVSADDYWSFVAGRWEGDRCAVCGMNRTRGTAVPACRRRGAHELPVRGPTAPMRWRGFKGCRGAGPPPLLALSRFSWRPPPSRRRARLGRVTRAKQRQTVMATRCQRVRPAGSGLFASITLPRSRPLPSQVMPRSWQPLLAMVLTFGRCPGAGWLPSTRAGMMLMHRPLRSTRTRINWPCS